MSALINNNFTGNTLSVVISIAIGTSAKALIRSAFFMASFNYGGLFESVSTRRSRTGNANRRQSATQLLSINSGGSFTLYEGITL